MTDAREFIVRGSRVLIDGRLQPATLLIRDGRIARIESGASSALGLPRTDPELPVVDAADDVVLPGLVDSHVHINEPGRTEWEGFETATQAAAAGGITTLVDMPLNCIPATTSAQALEEKLSATTGQLCVDVAFWGGVIPGNTSELPGLASAGVAGFKCFLVPSGVDEFPAVEERHLHEAMPVLAQLDLPLLVHAELPGPIVEATRSLLADPSADPASYDTYLASRPPEAEVQAIEMMIRLSRVYGTRVHIVHLATSQALAALSAARAEGVRITVETCPHYLHFAAESIRDRDATCKCAPPIRGQATREALWSALGDAEIDLIATDHSPCPPALKALDRGDFFAAWGGIASVQLGLSVVWRGARQRGYSIDRVADWMCAAPARLAGLDGKKGRLTNGADADFVIWDPDGEYEVTQSMLRHRHATTPYAGMRLPGVIKATYLRGQRIFDGTTVERGLGRPLLRVATPA